MAKTNAVDSMADMLWRASAAGAECVRQRGGVRIESAPIDKTIHTGANCTSTDKEYLGAKRETGEEGEKGRGSDSGREISPSLSYTKRTRT